MKRRIGLVWVILSLCAAISPAQPRQPPADTRYQMLWDQVQEFRLTDPPPLSARDCAMAQFGRKLFFERRISAEGTISCASCHVPERSFTDGKAVAVGMHTLRRNAPPLLNLHQAGWLFWDGRADSLETQAMQPVESAAEHGFDRVGVFRVIADAYRDSYERLFGAFPVSTGERLPAFATAPPAPISMSNNMINYGLATLGDIDLFNNIVQAAQQAGISPDRYVNDYLFNPAPDKHTAQAHKAYLELSDEDRTHLDMVFVNAVSAIAVFERHIVANQSAFDTFLSRWKRDLPPETAFTDRFGEQEFFGLRLFTGAGQCVFCHSGPTLSDGQFHNIGLPQQDKQVDYGRTLGLLQSRSSIFNCNSTMLAHLPNVSDSEVCREQQYTNSENLEMLGAFKTPSLRNVMETAPYAHDGRFSTLAEVLDHYNRLAHKPAIGHREETLRPLALSTAQLSALQAFLAALSSPVRDLSAANACE